MKPTLPPFADVDSAPFWEGVRSHRLLVQRCRDCGRLLFPARPICAHCAGSALEWVPVSGRGTVISWVVTHQVFNKLFADAVPYTTVLVQLEEQPDLLMYGNLADEGAEAGTGVRVPPGTGTRVPPGTRAPAGQAVQSGMAVQAVFEDHDEGFTLVQWAAR
jgi:uncharacterized OB-fold protein